jgi:drug/metabolite transporter (DMT)-like permease
MLPLARGGVTRVAVLQFAQPVASLILTVLLLSERLTAPLIVAAIAILAGVAFARRGESNGNAAQSVPAE